MLETSDKKESFSSSMSQTYRSPESFDQSFHIHGRIVVWCQPSLVGARCLSAAFNWSLKQPSSVIPFVPVLIKCVIDGYISTNLKSKLLDKYVFHIFAFGDDCAATAYRGYHTGISINMFPFSRSPH